MKTAISRLGNRTKYTFDSTVYVERAFKLGLWYSAIPEICREDIEINNYTWVLEGADLKFNFISDTGTSWRELYRLWREKGWQRKSVEREGGNLTYILTLSDLTKPEGYQTLTFALCITISTCKQVSKGKVMKEVEEFETVCEDLVEVEDSSDIGESLSEEFDPVETSSEGEPLPADDTPF